MGTEKTSSMFLPFLDKLKDARSSLLNDLKSSLYGEYTDSFFNNTALLNSTIYSKSPRSKDRLKRRLKIKFLESQLGDKSPASFTWVTGGHSAAAGHGNLFTQSYTAILETTLQKVFKIVNIDFKAKNYAMGGTSSGPEVSLCMEALFGLDIDFLSWEYGMTDGREHFLWELWIQRAEVHRTRPILMDFGCHDSINLPMEESGMGIFSFVKNKYTELIPDSENNPDLEKLPPGLKYYKCGTVIENKEPCKDHKFDTKKVCKRAKHQVSWHNGWKDHGTIGRLLAFFLLQNLEDAIAELDAEFTDIENSKVLKNIEKLSPNSYLNHLLKLEEEDKAAFLSSPLSQLTGKPVNTLGLENFQLFHRVKTLCHNAQLPSQARFDGLLSQKKNKKGLSIQLVAN